MKKKTALAISALLFFITFLTRSSYAKIIFEANFEGTALITSPTGEITLIEPGQPIPEIASGSTIEVFDGHLTVVVEGTDTAKVACLGHRGTAGGGSSVGLTCSDNSGSFKMLKGSGQAFDLNGKEQVLGEGAEYAFKKSPDQQETPPTAAGAPTGGPPVGGNLADAPPVDSRSIESSIA